MRKKEETLHDRESIQGNLPQAEVLLERFRNLKRGVKLLDRTQMTGAKHKELKASVGWAGPRDRSPFLERKGCPTSNLFPYGYLVAKGGSAAWMFPIPAVNPSV
ncbi:hypothetical protein VNO80_33863 [Phaseolus coccineus]|uniref:Uncharacterized protein n=1 Tax=Phaseolus coccineus TaxID=3886 RepID=A0AAN9QC80_PHACN